MRRKLICCLCFSGHNNNILSFYPHLATNSGIDWTLTVFTTATQSDLSGFTTTTTEFYIKMAMRNSASDFNPNAYTVTYDSSKHWKVLTQLRGSVWPTVSDNGTLTCNLCVFEYAWSLFLTIKNSCIIGASLLSLQYKHHGGVVVLARLQQQLS